MICAWHKCSKKVYNGLKYCSPAHRRCFHSENLRRKNGCLATSNKLLLCPVCKEKFIPTGRNIFCSLKCRHKNENRIRRDKPAEFGFQNRLKYNHRISLPEYKILISLGCSLCGEPFSDRENRLRPCIDHNHTCCPRNKSCSKCRRGLIHNKCNLLLGYAEDNIKILQKAILYLRGKYDL